MPAQELSQVQVQRQTLRLSPQQVLVSQLVELPLTDLEQRVRDELYENVALEEGRDPDADDGPEGPDEEPDAPGEGAEEASADAQTGDDAWDDDTLPVYTPETASSGEDYGPLGDTKSFIDELVAQIAEYDVSDRQRAIIAYLIGMLDDRGFIDRPLPNISDDLLFTVGLEVSVGEIEEALHTLQQFDPCGIGARNLRECLLLQLDRQISLLDEAEASEERLRQREVLARARQLVDQHFRLFERNERERLMDSLGCTTEQLREAIAAIGRLNPHPGRSLHEGADDRALTVMPDFIVETDPHGGVTLTLNMRGVPSLRVSEDYQRQLAALQGDTRLSHAQREAYAFAKQRVDSARSFINALRQRQQTLRSTMRAIIDLQREFILTQDDTALKPLRLQDVAERTGLSISTTSRVVNSKYVALDGKIYALKQFFMRTKQGAQGGQVMRNKVKALLRDLIDQEDKASPLSDEQLMRLLSEQGEPVSRRTVAKYRNAMKIPSAPLRRR